MEPGPEPKVTVVIPAYKAEKTIARAIDSVLAQQGCDLTVIVVVNPEVDRTPEIVRGYGDPRVRLIVNDENKGAPFSRNRGLALAEDEFVMFHCADDFIEGPLLAGLVGEMSRAGADLGLGPMQTLFERKGTRGPTTFLDAPTVQAIFTGWLEEFRFVAPCCVLWRTSFVREIGGWDPEVPFLDDGYLVMRAMLLGAKVVTSRQGRGVYVIHNAPTKLTLRSDNLDSLLTVPSKLMSIQSDVVDPETMKRACAASYYRAARTAFTRGRDDLGHEALRRSRQLGLKGHRGPAAHRLLSSVIGLRLRCKLEYAARAVLGRPGG